MLLKNTESNVRPSSVLVDRLADGTANVRLADNIREEKREDENGEQSIFVYDEAVFTLGTDRQETAEEIEAHFEAWWEFGSADEEPEPTTEERVSMLEEIVMAMIGGIE